MAGRQGFEPRLHGPEPRVLPLNDLPPLAEPLIISNDTGRSKTDSSANPDAPCSVQRGIRRILTTVAAVLVTAGSIVRVAERQERMPLDDLLARNAHALMWSDTGLSGPGGDLLLDAARDTQFFVIAEEHNLRELNQLASVVFESLHEAHGYDHVALEQGGVITSWLGDPEHRGDLQAIRALVARYPHALTFATDEELEFIATVGRISTAAHALVARGADQSGLTALIEEAASHERNRGGDVHYLAQRADLDQIAALGAFFNFNRNPASEGQRLIDALTRSARIYRNNRLDREGQPTGYESGREREMSMKHRFMERYREARRSLVSPAHAPRSSSTCGRCGRSSIRERSMGSKTDSPISYFEPTRRS